MAPGTHADPLSGVAAEETPTFNVKSELAAIAIAVMRDKNSAARSSTRQARVSSDICHTEPSGTAESQESSSGALGHASLLSGNRGV